MRETGEREAGLAGVGPADRDRQTIQRAGWRTGERSDRVVECIIT